MASSRSAPLFAVVGSRVFGDGSQVTVLASRTGGVAPVKVITKGTILPSIEDARWLAAALSAAAAKAEGTRP